jgi:RNA polymerase sigma factor (sigma-70 family)
MPSLSLIRALQDLRQLVGPSPGAEATDRQLLKRYSAQRDEAAFAELVRRHGPTVLGVCRRVLRECHQAEDAFQATFLVLARKAGTVTWQASAGGWLFRTAHYLALKMKSHADRHRTQPIPDEGLAAPHKPPLGELGAILDEELTWLPEKYRAVLVLCHCEDKTRDEAARQLGWKPGAVKIRLERGKQLLRQRLARRGLACTVATLGALIAEGAAPAAVSPKLLQTTVQTATAFAAGEMTAASPIVIASAKGALHAMTIAKLKLATLAVLLLGIAATGIGLLSARPASPNNLPAQVPGELAEVAVVPFEFNANDQPALSKRVPRVLLFAGGPTREFQFTRRLFVNEVDRKRAELSIYLQNADDQAVLDVPLERRLKEFPSALKLDEDEKGDAAAFLNLARYDVIIAFDPDWSKVAPESLKLLEQWANRLGGGLIQIAGPIHTYQLSRGANRESLKPLLGLLPVQVDDSRLAGLIDRTSDRPWPLRFASVTEDMKSLQLDPFGKGPLAGWSEFFHGRAPGDVKDGEPAVRGFYDVYSVKEIKPGAIVLATFTDPKTRFVGNGKQPQDAPYLVTMPYGKGRVVYLGGGETWRLRAFQPSYHERFWSNLVRLAVGRLPEPPAQKAERRGQGMTPEERQAIAKGLEALVKEQFRDGHWESAGGAYPTLNTGLAGLALLMEGSTLREGKYAGQVRRAVDWFTDNSQRGGLIGHPNNPAERRYLDGHGFGMMFLASVCGEEEDQDRRQKLAWMLTKAVEFTAKAQSRKGGWGPIPFNGVNDFADPGPTLVQIQALLAARHAGIPVPQGVIDRARKYLEEHVEKATPEEAGAAALAVSLGDAGTPTVQTWLRGAARLPPPEKMGEGLDAGWCSFLHARLAFQLGDQGFRKLVPDAKPVVELTWSGHRQATFAYLLAKQKADGAWHHLGMGTTHSTALALLILQLEEASLPAFQRQVAQ